MACRLCSTNDRETLADQLAEEMWESWRDRDIDPEWADAGSDWHMTLRQFAETTIRMLEDR